MSRASGRGSVFSHYRAILLRLLFFFFLAAERNVVYFTFQNEEFGEQLQSTVDAIHKKGDMVIVLNCSCTPLPSCFSLLSRKRAWHTLTHSHTHTHTHTHTHAHSLHTHTLHTHTLSTHTHTHTHSLSLHTHTQPTTTNQGGVLLTCTRRWRITRSICWSGDSDALWTS